MSRILASFALACLTACHAAPSTSPPAHEPSGPIKHVLLVTVDGLIPDAYLNPDARGLKVPTLRRLVRDGAYGRGTRSVFPSVTYPSHTSIATGVLPAKHGIVNNRTFDPFEKNHEAWYWYREELMVPTIDILAQRAGLRTALLNWPVSVGAKANWLFPEYWRARQPEDLKLIRALSTPGLIEEAQKRVPDLASRLTPPVDSALVDLSSYVIEADAPHLLLLHIWQVDEAQHHHGPWSAEALAAIENADAQLGRLFASLERAGIAQATAVVIASDHGFAAVERQYHPRALLREAGLIDVDAAGKVTDYRATVTIGGGAAFLHVRDDDPSVERAARALFEARAGQPGSGIARIFSREELRVRGSDPRAAFALEAEACSYFGWGLTAYETPAPYRGMHGYDPERPEMQASLLWTGPGIQPGPRADTQLLDIAPTVAHWLGLSLPASDGKVLQ